MSVQSYVKLYNALLLNLEAYLLKTSIQYLLLIICLCLFYIFFLLTSLKAVIVSP